mgnify:CR=1 FL=1
MLVVGVRSRGHASVSGPVTSATALRCASGEPACVTIESGGRAIGHLGILGRRGSRAADLKHAFAAVAEFDLDGLTSSPSRDNAYTAAPELPSVEVDVSLPRSGGLLLQYVVTGSIGDLRIPPVSAPTRTADLWQHTCFEAFVAIEGASGYHELNLAPSGEWAMALT